MSKFDVNTTGKDVVEAYGNHAAGKTFLITGPSEGGLGAELVTTLAKASPARIILAGRNEAKITPVIESLKKINSGIKVTFVPLDLADNASVRKAAEKVNAEVDKIDVLLNNAGIAGQRKYQVSSDGVEIHFATNYLGHFLFTNLILGKILAAKGTIINITSMAYTLSEVDTDDVNFDDGRAYQPWFAYARSKTANILFTYALGERLRDRVAVFAVDPGMAHDSKLLTNSGVDDEIMAEGHRLAVERNGGKEIPPPPLVSMQQACATALVAALDPSLRGQAPCFLKECANFPTLPFAHDPTAAAKLWSLSEKLVGQEFSA